MATTKQRRILQMRYKAGGAYESHRRSHPEVGQISPSIRSDLNLPTRDKLLPVTLALISGDRTALAHFAGSALDKQCVAHPDRIGLWRPGKNARCPLVPSVRPAGVFRNVANDATYNGGGRDRTTSADIKDSADTLKLAASSAAMTEEMRFLMDCFGFLHLKALLSPEQIEQARRAYTEALQSPDEHHSAPLGLPALESLISHPTLLRIYGEFAGENDVRLVSAGLLHSPPRAEAAAKVGGAQLHCQREYDHLHAMFGVRPSGLGDGDGRITLNNWVTFPYFDSVQPGDGGTQKPQSFCTFTPTWFECMLNTPISNLRSFVCVVLSIVR